MMILRLRKLSSCPPSGGLCPLMSIGKGEAALRASDDAEFEADVAQSDRLLVVLSRTLVGEALGVLRSVHYLPRAPVTGWLVTAEISFLTVLEARSRKTKQQQQQTPQVSEGPCFL